MMDWFEKQIVGPLREIAKNWGNERSSIWNEVRKEHLKKFPACAICGREDVQMNVHHIHPFHVRPDLELASENLITLCRDHHFDFGHLRSWKSWNANIREDAMIWSNRFKNRPGSKEDYFNLGYKD